MRRTYYLFFFCWVFQLPYTLSQQINLPGQISIHNSDYLTGQIEYVGNAQITAAFTSPTTSDHNGRFLLSFIGLPVGTVVGLKVEKAKLEIVNQRDLDNVVLGRQLPLRVYLAPQGSLVKAQTELYNIALDKLIMQKDEYLLRLKGEREKSRVAIRELEEKFKVEILTKYRAIELLEQNFAEVQRRLPEIALKLGSVNLDFATDLYRRAYERFKAGQIEEVVEMLDNELIDKDYVEASANAKKIKEDVALLNQALEVELQRIVQSIESYRLKAESYLLLYQYEAAANGYQRILEILERERSQNYLPLAKYNYIYQTVGDIYASIASNEEAAKYYDQALAYDQAEKKRFLLFKSGKSHFFARNLERSKERFLTELDFAEVTSQQDSLCRLNAYSHLIKIDLELGTEDKFEEYRQGVARYSQIFGDYSSEEDLDDALDLIETAKPLLEYLEANPAFVKLLPEEKVMSLETQLKDMARTRDELFVSFEENPSYGELAYQDNPQAVLAFIKGIGTAGDMARIIGLQEEAHYFYSKCLMVAETIKTRNPDFQKAFAEEYSSKQKAVSILLKD